MNLITIPAGKIGRGQLVFDEDGEQITGGKLTGRCRMNPELELEVLWFETSNSPDSVEYVCARFVKVRED